MTSSASKSALSLVAAALACLLVLAGGTLITATGACAQIQFGPTDGWGETSDVDPAVERQALKEFERNPEAGLPTLSPANVEATKKAIKRYTDIVAAGGWLAVPDDVVKPGESSPAVAALRARLAVSGELSDAGSGEALQGDVFDALKAYQTTNGLTPNGRIDKPTIAALNVPAQDRLKQLKTNLTRLGELTGVVKAQRKYVIVNIPAAQVEAVALNRVVSRYTGVVGKVDRPTPLLRSTITEMNFNPIWRLPPTVIQKDLIPQGRRMQAEGKNVLIKTGIEAYDGNGKKVDPEKIDWNSSQPQSFAYRQPPGKENPLGFVKINFASGESVYMHDSPSEGLFGRNFRAASSGCIRVHNVEKLANWLLAQNDGWDEDRVAKIKESGQRLDVRLATPVALHFVYITAWATEDGVIQFRRDLYNRDGVSEIATSY
ncbi:MAG: L,D-transpeptidase family protein [Hyphomicrobium sp.]